MTRMKEPLWPCVLICSVLVYAGSSAPAREYDFQGSMSRQVLENYLSRSTTMLDLLTGRDDLEDNIRMLRATGAKFAGRTVASPHGFGQEDAIREIWAGERPDPVR